MKNPISTQELAGLVEPARLHKRLYLDPDIFELEMERIWGQAWIFIGHESQVPHTGDYFSTNITHKIPVVMVRDKDGKVHVLHNRCGHKGAKLVESREGNVRGAFRCPYHGWTFRHDGTLLKIPNDKGYDGTGF
ncbi:MAG TPA: Rieske 2Fe-2S domain-containing protein, partial [Kineobactrum sp.]